MNVPTISGDRVRCVLPCKAILGESPVWHPEEQSLFWIDIQRKQIHRYHPATGRNRTFDLPEIVTSTWQDAKSFSNAVKIDFLDLP